MFLRACLRRRRYNNIVRRMSIDSEGMPTPIPTLAPVERPLGSACTVGIEAATNVEVVEAPLSVVDDAVAGDTIVVDDVSALEVVSGDMDEVEVVAIELVDVVVGGGLVVMD
jgi:hypothetical protein